MSPISRMHILAALKGKGPFLLLGLLFSVLLWRSATSGPDYFHYLAWARAMVTGDIFTMESPVGSPLGVPLSQWSHGPGLLYGLPALLYHLPVALPAGVTRFAGDSLWAGWAAGVLTWGALFGILRQVFKATAGLAFFVGAVAFLGSHLGFYSFTHGSESLTNGFLTLLAYWVLTPRVWNRVNVFLGALLAAWAVLIRPYAGLYAGLGIMVMVSSLAGKNNTSSPGRRLLLAVAALVPFLVVGVEFALVNRWMTGSPFHSPYLFGNSEFHSLDFSSPEFFAVLAHPWHGLLVYHPLYLLGILLLLRQWGQAPEGRLRLLYAGSLAALIAHLYLQASWYCWWLGTGTFGMRGMSAGAIILILVLGKTLQEQMMAGRPVRPLQALLLCFCLWSYGLMLMGETNFTTFSELFRSQFAIVTTPVFWFSVLMALAAVAVRRWLRLASEDPFADGAVFLLPLVFFALTSGVEGNTMPMPARSALALTGTGLGLAVLAGNSFPCWENRRWEKHLGTILILVSLVATGLFFRLAISTENYIAARTPIPRSFQFNALIRIEEVRESYEEYLWVPGFTEKKRLVQRFIQENEIKNQ